VPACVVYNKENGNISRWGHAALDALTDNRICGDEEYLDDFLTKLYRIYQKNEEERDYKDNIIILVLGNFLQVQVNEAKQNLLIKQRHKEHSNVIPLSFHFIFVVPTELDYNFRDDILRPIFIAAGLVTEMDHSSRLLFFRKLECNLQLFRLPYEEFRFNNGRLFNATRDLERGASYIICKLNITEDGVFSLDWNAFEFKDVQAANFHHHHNLIPNLLNSGTLEIDLDRRAKIGLSKLLCSNGFEDNGLIQEDILDYIKSLIMTYFRDKAEVIPNIATIERKLF
jgi:hypothetical protein